jgi:hypothetical protein
VYFAYGKNHPLRLHEPQKLPTVCTKRNSLLVPSIPVYYVQADPDPSLFFELLDLDPNVQIALLCYLSTNNCKVASLTEKINILRVQKDV